MNRRHFLGCTLGGAALAVVGVRPGPASGQPAQGGESPYGPLSATFDDNGLFLPAGFTSRVIARGLTPVAATGHLWHIFPDGGATFPTDDGGWIYVSNSENPPPVLDLPLPPGIVEDLVNQLLALGGVGAIRFGSGGDVVDAYPILAGQTRSNCAGGTTPWGTWLSCEEWEGGRVWECDPVARTAQARPALGTFKHEMAAADPDGKKIYLTEDQSNGLFYRFTPAAWGDLSAGVLEAAGVDGTTNGVTWLPVPDPAAASIRTSFAGATPFNGGEGCVYDQGRVYVTTKGDDRVWVHDIAAQTMTVLYDGALGGPLTGVDNIIVSALSHDLYVAEDGGNLEVCIITTDGVVAPIVRMDMSPAHPEHGLELGIPGVPIESEVTGLAFSPDGNRLYFNSERGGIFGILYEVSGPFRGSPLAAAPAAPSTPAPVPAPAPAPAPVAPTLPATGLDGVGWVGAGALAASAALWRLRNRVEGVTRTRP